MPDYTDRTQEIIDQAGGQLSDDIAGMADGAKRVVDTGDTAKQANTQRNLDIAVGGKAGDMKSFAEAIAAYAGDPKNLQVGDDVKAFQKHAKNMRDMAKAAQQVGDIQRYNVLTKGASMMDERVKALVMQYAGGSATSQPAGGQ